MAIEGAAIHTQARSWRGSSACVAALTFDVDAESPILAEGRRYADYAMVMTHQAFGPRVGVPRILKLLAELDVPATFFIPGLTAERYPAMVESILEQGHEVAHHTYTHRPPVSMTDQEERADFERALGVLDRFSVQPKGYRAALWQSSWRTPTLVAEYGMTYDSSLMDADTPYLLSTPGGEIAELPPHWSLDDWEQYAFLPEPRIGEIIGSPKGVADMWINELRAMRKHNALFMLTCHPFLSGRASRIEALRAVIEAGLEFGDVAFSTCAEVAAAAHADDTIGRHRLEPVEVGADWYPRW